MHLVVGEEVVLLLRKKELWRVIATMSIAGAASPIGTDLHGDLTVVLRNRLSVVSGMICVELLCRIEPIVVWRVLRVVVVG